MDGVLADFDKRAIEIVGCRPRDYEDREGADKLWDQVYSVGDFFLSLDLMPDALELWFGVHDLGFEPTILTGTPRERERNDSMLPAAQKRLWAMEKLNTDRIITCPSKDKCLHMKQPGDVLIDDWMKYIYRWEEHGGVFILHKSAQESLRALRAYKEQMALI